MHKAIYCKNEVNLVSHVNKISRQWNNCKLLIGITSYKNRWNRFYRQNEELSVCMSGFVLCYNIASLSLSHVAGRDNNEEIK